MNYMSAGDVPRPPSPGEGGVERGERGYRRKKWAAFAGNLYRTGQQAVTEMRETYAQSRARDLDDFDGQAGMHIPGSFPDVAITAQGDEQMVLFPCYAKRHTRRKWPSLQEPQGIPGCAQDEEYWRQQWERTQDEKAVVDVDVKGWIYSPHSGPMTRRNRFLIGLARQLSGISAPRTDQTQGTSSQVPDESEQGEIAQEAAKIERIGQEERLVASRGAYSEQVAEGPGEAGYSLRPPRPMGGNLTPDSTPSSPNLQARATTNGELTEAELAAANANLMARIAPFLTSPLIALTISLFFYNTTKSASRTVVTNDAGHFSIRAALDFIPTHVRILANERLSATQEIAVTEPCGVSVISDIDDTVKLSNISGGAREIFRNTFVRELGDLTIDGVREWYGEMHALGVSMHYCSNSPWQLFPMLATFFRLSGLPPGSLHLKQYSGMLQGIFEPVAERKKGTLARLLRDFPQRRFVLVGDSGEVDLEVYTELAVANPGRVLAVFIRDVTTPEGAPFADSVPDLARQKRRSVAANDGRANGVVAGGSKMRLSSAPGPVMGTLIDFAQEPDEARLDEAAALEQVSAVYLLRKPPPPPRPVKPVCLSGVPVGVGLGLGTEPQIRPASQGSMPAAVADRPLPPPPPPPPRRRATPSGIKRLSPRMPPRPSGNSDVEFDPLPPSVAPPPAGGMNYFYRSDSRSGNTSPSGSPTLGAANKKLELWRRRVGRAHEQLDAMGVPLYTWRRGQDVAVEAVAIIRRALEEMGI